MACYYGIEPFTRRNLKKKSAFLVAASVCCQKATGNSDSQRLQKYQYSVNWGKKVVLYLLAKVYNGHNGYVLHF